MKSTRFFISRAHRLTAWLIASGIILIGCQIEHESAEPTVERIPIVLSGGIVNPFTKAAQGSLMETSTSYLPSGTDFSLFAWTEDSEEVPDFMYSQPIHNEGGSVQGSFTYSPVKYWPSDGKSLTFVGVWPDGCEGLSVSSSSDPLSLSFSVASESSSQKDLLIAGPIEAYSSDSPLGMAFSHALSRVRVSIAPESAFATDGFAVVVHSVTLSSVIGNGVWTPEEGWSVSEEDRTETYACGLSGQLRDILLLLPQSTQGISVVADFSVHVLDVEGESVSSSRHQLSASLPEVNGESSWRAGCSYAYNVIIRETRLEVTALLEPWTIDESTFDYSTEISIDDGDRLQWTSGTYSSLDYSSFRLITRWRTDAEATFTIATPEGAVWYAILETLSGDSDAFCFVDSEGNESGSARGLVGVASSVTIRQKYDYPASTNMARLSFVVRSAGRNIPVTTLVDNLNHNWTLVQNANN